MEHRRDIDGMRAIAVLAVLAFHAFPAAVPGGFAGVDVFFVISGYLITGIIARDLDGGTFSIGAFYARRIRRIFPALIAVLAASLAIGWFVLLPARYANLGTHVVGSASFVENFVVWSEVGYFDVRSIEKPLLHLWSLGVEEQFYLVWPVLLVALSRLRAPAPVVLGALAVGSLCASVALGAPAGFYLSLSRMWELALGGLLAFVPTRTRSPALAVVGLAAIAAALALFDGDSPYPGWRAVVPTAGTVLVIAAGPASAVNRVLGARPLVAIGLVSYPLYLWHWPLLSFGLLAGHAEPSPAMRLAILAASGVLAALTYLALERPIRRRRASARQALALAFALVAVAAAGRLVAQRDGIASRFPAVAEPLLAYRYDYLADAHAGTCWLTIDAPADGFAPACSPAKAPGLFVWGDSHAARLRPGLERVHGEAFAIGSATRDLCPPSPSVEGRCRESNLATLARLERSPPAVVVLFAAWTRVGKLDDVVELAARLVRAGVGRVVVVGPAPRWMARLPAVLYEAWNARSFDQPAPRRLASDLDPQVAIWDREMKSLPWPQGVGYVSAYDLLCDAEGCATYAPGSATELTAYDDVHLTTAGAVVVARGISLR